MSNETAFESLEMLESHVYLKIQRVHNASKLFHSVTMTSYGLEEYARNYVTGYESLEKDVVHQIVNLDQRDSRDISKALDRPILLINRIVESLEQQRRFKMVISHTGDYNLHIFQVSPTLKRMLD